MTVSKIDLLNKKFTRTMRGYSPEEVNLVVLEAAEALGDLADANRRLAERVAELEEELARTSRGSRPVIQDALDTGRRIVSDLQGKARQEARQIVDEAREQARRVLTDAGSLQARTMEEIGELQAVKRSFETRMRAILEEHFRLLEAREAEEDKTWPEGDFTFDPDRE